MFPLDCDICFLWWCDVTLPAVGRVESTKHNHPGEKWHKLIYLLQRSAQPRNALATSMLLTFLTGLPAMCFRDVGSKVARHLSSLQAAPIGNCKAIQAVLAAGSCKSCECRMHQNAF